jgi:hypothetical protein
MPWAPTYCDVESLKAYLRIPEDDDLDDVELTNAVEAASRAVDDYTMRQFGIVEDAEARYYTPTYNSSSGRYRVAIDDLMTTQGAAIAVDSGDATFSNTVDVADAAWLPLNAVSKGEAWTEILLPAGVMPDLSPGSVRVTARWGWSAVPGAVKQATLMQAARLVKRREAVFGVAGSPEMGSEIRLLAKLDPDVAVTLRRYRRLWWGA